MDITWGLTVRDLVHADLASCGWAGSAVHLDGVARQLERARGGAVDYLAVCGTTGVVLAKGGVDYEATPGAGTLWQLAVRPAVQSRGIGTFLVGAAEARIRDRGLLRAELSVEESNPRARALYERLGYVAYDRRPDGWDVQAPDGSIRRHETVCVVLWKDLARRPSEG
ncbi:N-acetyltransferase [Streptomyces sp. NPDC046203]|uniref:GNAT family N-acetyltransferase n=1 Tax=Streptomyces sp. NPDC046203 TaxID=3154602 RepID=UPI0033FA6362